MIMTPESLIMFEVTANYRDDNYNFRTLDKVMILPGQSL